MEAFRNSWKQHTKQTLNDLLKLKTEKQEFIKSVSLPGDYRERGLWSLLESALESTSRLLEFYQEVAPAYRAPIGSFHFRVLFG